MSEYDVKFSDMTADILDELREYGLREGHPCLVEMVDDEWDNRWVGPAPENGFQ